MHPLVRDLYKRFVIAGASYPGGYNAIRQKVKAGFHEKSSVATDLEIRKCVANGRYWVREIRAVAQLGKYRAMKRRYEGKI